MTVTIFERVRRFQERVAALGVSQRTLALPAPTTLLLSDSSTDAQITAAFTCAITEAEILEVCRDLFASGHYSLAVQESLKVVEKFIQRKINKGRLSGSQLMDLAFGPSDPRLFWSDRTTVSGDDEQKGYHRLFTGAMLGIRNPVTHEFAWVSDVVIAFEIICFAQHLLRKAKAATASPDRT